MTIDAVPEDPAIMLKLVKEYIQQVGSKACCYEDLKPYLSLSGEELTEWLSFLDLLSTTVVRCSIGTRRH
jgi:N-terminal acetyltransferase B complex non-catalytic subunit